MSPPATGNSRDVIDRGYRMLSGQLYRPRTSGVEKGIVSDNHTGSPGGVAGHAEQPEDHWTTVQFSIGLWFPIITPKCETVSRHGPGEDDHMRLPLIGLTFAILLLPVTASAQITINMANITCGQYLAMPPAQSRDFSSWMSGWFSYQTRRTFVDLGLHQQNIANLKAWCQRYPQESVMNGLQRAIGPT